MTAAECRVSSRVVEEQVVRARSALAKVAYEWFQWITTSSNILLTTAVGAPCPGMRLCFHCIAAFLRCFCSLLICTCATSQSTTLSARRLSKQRVPQAWRWSRGRLAVAERNHLPGSWPRHGVGASVLAL